MAQVTVKSQKRKGPAPTGKGLPVLVRLQPDAIARLDAWIAGRPEPQPTRPDVVRLALREWLAGQAPVGPAAVASQIEALETDLASIPQEQEQTPEGALHAMDRAIAENQLAALKGRRKRVRKAKRRSVHIDVR